MGNHTYGFEITSMWIFCIHIFHIVSWILISLNFHVECFSMTSNSFLLKIVMHKYAYSESN